MGDPKLVARTGASPAVVLVVEDDPSVRDLLVRGLSVHLTVLPVEDNQAAWELLQRIARPAVLLLDVMTPRLDGFSLARRLKAEEKLRDIPIVFLTARGGARDVAESIQSGARAYITKPFKLAAVIEKVGKLAGVVVPAAPRRESMPPPPALPPRSTRS